VKPKFARLEALATLARIFGMERFEEGDAHAAGTTVNILVGKNVSVEQESTTVQVGPLTITQNSP
jgi:hypothetical protein